MFFYRPNLLKYSKSHIYTKYDTPFYLSVSYKKKTHANQAEKRQNSKKKNEIKMDAFSRDATNV